MQTAAEKIETVKRMAAELRGLFSDGTVELRADGDGRITVSLFDVPAYSAGTKILQSLRVGKREKQVHDWGTRQWCCITGEEDGVTFRVFCDGLPSTCRLEKFTERIPKTQTVESGEFVEVERTRIVCGQEVDPCLPQATFPADGLERVIKANLREVFPDLK